MRALRIVRLILSVYVVCWLAVTPASRLGGPWWALGLMACALMWLIEAIEAVRGKR
jgi:4-hydroxybenzoate polyprenyltransferase